MKTLEELGFELESDYLWLVYKSKEKNMVEFSMEAQTPTVVQIGIEIYFDGSEVYAYEEIWYPTKEEFKRQPAILSFEVITAIANKIKEFKKTATKE